MVFLLLFVWFVFFFFHHNPFIYHAKKKYALKMSSRFEDLFSNRIPCSQTEITEGKQRSKVCKENSANGHALESIFPYHTYQHYWVWEQEHVCSNTQLMDNLNIQYLSIFQQFVPKLNWYYLLLTDIDINWYCC